MHLSPFVLSEGSLKIIPQHFFFFFKVPLKGMHLSPFVPSVIFGMKFENYSRPLFLFFKLPLTIFPIGYFRKEVWKLFCENLWKVCTFHHLSHRLFSEGSLKIIPDHFFFFLNFLWKVCTFHHLSHRLLSEEILKIFQRKHFLFLKFLWKGCTFHHLSHRLFFGRKFENCSTTTFFFFFFKSLLKVCTFHHLSHRLFSEGSLKIIPEHFFFYFKLPLKSMHLSAFVPSVTFRRNFENCSVKIFSFLKFL